MRSSVEDAVVRDAFTRLAAAADEFENYAHPHAERIARLADELAGSFGLGRADRASLRVAALAHDFGEMAMRRDYIKRAGALNAEEQLDLSRHPVIGEQEAARAGADRGAQLLVRWHQEWWNGTGYPDALSREQIPLAARLLRVADAYCALTDARPFRPALTEAEARKHLTEWAGLEFDPRVVRALLNLQGLPELRSYARRDNDDTSAQTAAQNDAPALNQATGGAGLSDARETTISGHVRETIAGNARETTISDARNSTVGGVIPEMGVNPDAQSAGSSAQPGASAHSSMPSIHATGADAALTSPEREHNPLSLPHADTNEHA